MRKWPRLSHTLVSFALTLVLLLGTGERTFADDPAHPGSGNADTAPVTPIDTLNPLADFIRQLIITVGNGPLYHPSREIDRIVGSPWTLNPTTAEKFARLPANLQMQFNSALSRNPRTLIQQPNEALQISDALSTFNDFAGRASSFFSPEEWIDLAVFYLSRQSFFPPSSDQTGWQKIKKLISDNIVYIGAGILAGAALSNQMSLGVSESPLKWSGPKGREQNKAGWYASFRDFGIKLQPTLRTGVSLNSPELDLSLGGVYKINPSPGTEHFDIEFFAREHAVASVTKPHGWDVGVSSSGKLKVDTPQPGRGRFNVGLDAYAVRIDSNASSPWRLMTSTSFATDFVSQTQTRLNVGVQDLENDINVGLSFQDLTDTLQPITGNQLQVGMFLNGTFESRSGSAATQMRIGAQNVREDLDVIRQLHKRLDAVKAQLKTFGSGELTLKEESELLALRWDLENSMTQTRENLSIDFKEYVRFRDHFLFFQKHKILDDDLQQKGPLDAHDFEEAQKELGSPAYSHPYVTYSSPAVTNRSTKPAEETVVPLTSPVTPSENNSSGVGR